MAAKTASASTRFNGSKANVSSPSLNTRQPVRHGTIQIRQKNRAAFESGEKKACEIFGRSSYRRLPNA
jgi:hypothetical protein